MKTALLVIATGQRYLDYAEQMLKSARKFFVPHDSWVWTDAQFVEPRFSNYVRPALYTGFPDSTLYRYNMILDPWIELQKYDQLFYCDADMKFVAPVGPEIFSDGITATEHPGYVGVKNTPHEKRPQSRAYTPAVERYFCGGFIGGDAKAFMQMAANISTDVVADEIAGIRAVWNDESHSNAYLFENPPAKILSPAYCFPEEELDGPRPGFYGQIWQRAGRPVYNPILVAINKRKHNG